MTNCHNAVIARLPFFPPQDKDGKPLLPKPEKKPQVGAQIGQEPYIYIYSLEINKLKAFVMT